jgi:hypothetical protein
MCVIAIKALRPANVVFAVLHVTKHGLTALCEALLWADILVLHSGHSSD